MGFIKNILLRSEILIGLFLVTSLLQAEVAKEGKVIFELCVYCHGDNGEGKADLAAPSIAGLPSWYVERQLNNYKNGLRGKHGQDIEGMRMRPMARTLKDEQIPIISDYVSKMEKAPIAADSSFGDPKVGQTKYQVCVACHGADGNGNQALNAPPLTHLQDWYMLTQLKKFKSKIRGTDPIGATMAPMAAMLDDEGMKDVISYIYTLNKAQK